MSESDGWREYRRIPERKEARRVTERETVETSHGPVVAEPGDYVVRGENGDTWPVSGEKFGDLYEPVDDADGDGPAAFHHEAEAYDGGR